MSRILFLNGSAHGHINPTLPVVKELVHRGHTVNYFSTAEFREKIEAAGAGFLDFGKKVNKFFQSYKPAGNHPFYTLVDFLLKLDRIVVPIVLDWVRDNEIDFIVHDAMLGGGNIAAKKLKLPAICSCTSFAMNKPPLPLHMLEPGFHPQMNLLYQDIKAARLEWDFEQLDIMDIFFKKEDANLVFTSKSFQPLADSFDESFKFVGPSISPRAEVFDFPPEEMEKGPVIYISMGTINNSCVEFYKKCIEAFKESKYKIIMSVGTKAHIGELGEIPNNFIVRNHIPQLEVLKKTDVFISHGGLNSVSEALYYGVPVIAIPQANDQPMVARQLVNLGAGLCLDKGNVTAELLRDTVGEVVSNRSYKGNSMDLGKSFIQAGGYKAAAEYIIERGKIYNGK